MFVHVHVQPRGHDGENVIQLYWLMESDIFGLRDAEINYFNVKSLPLTP